MTSITTINANATNAAMDPQRVMKSLNLFNAIVSAVSGASNV